jgi:hypothetical protein
MPALDKSVLRFPFAAFSNLLDWKAANDNDPLPFIPIVAAVNNVMTYLVPRTEEASR